MTDIVERLRDRNAEYDAIDRMLDEAANEIERLREEECKQHNHITELMREIERLRAENAAERERCMPPRLGRALEETLQSILRKEK